MGMKDFKGLAVGLRRRLRVLVGLWGGKRLDKCWFDSYPKGHVLGVFPLGASV
jgi:hypothetical protein